MNKTAIRFAAVAAVAGLGIAGCSSKKATSTGSTSSPASASASTSAPSTPASSSSSGGGTATGSVGVILPDTQSSARWETADKPALTKAFADAGIKADIQNALGDKTKFQSIAQGMIQEKVNVLILVALDSPSAATVEQQAQSAGIKVIDYDRLVLGGSGQFYVSYDNTVVGQLQGQCLSDALKDKPTGQIIYIDGSPTDNNATLFANGAHSVLDKTTLKKVSEKAIPDWKNDVAGTTFQQLLTANGNKVDGVLVANDGMAQSVITVLKGLGLNGKVPVTGQDATPAGLQSVLRGDQTCTIYKDATNEANGAAKLAIDLIQGKDTSADATQKTHDATGNRDVPSVLLKPELITKATVGDPIKSGAVKYSDVCTADLVAACTAAGISAS